RARALGRGAVDDRELEEFRCLRGRAQGQGRAAGVIGAEVDRAAGRADVAPAELELRVGAGIEADPGLDVGREHPRDADVIATTAREREMALDLPALLAD